MAWQIVAFYQGEQQIHKLCQCQNVKNKNERNKSQIEASEILYHHQCFPSFVRDLLMARNKSDILKNII